ncbi:unnamed protein product [Angiostrongylus costaricensis]|uniref:ATPase_AAA_core domain-containing protein n=1 Tax=Angiostrongylus costaricensis TaxID=334426 RepID=A0A0R3PSE9_ANGCS|nr:unnamed protein product [Angiostrongylus costaricensis]
MRKDPLFEVVRNNALFFQILISIMDTYLSEKQVARRRGMLNVRFRPLMHLRGEDDWRKQIGMEALDNQMMDENGIVYDLSPTRNTKISSIFTGPTGSTHRG